MSEQPVVSPNVISNIISLETNKNKQTNRTKQIKNPKKITTLSENLLAYLLSVNFVLL